MASEFCAYFSEHSACSIFMGGINIWSCLHYLWRWNRQNFPKCRHIKFRRRGITQKKEYNKIKLNSWIKFVVSRYILSLKEYKWNHVQFKYSRRSQRDAPYPDVARWLQRSWSKWWKLSQLGGRADCSQCSPIQRFDEDLVQSALSFQTLALW
jgi:hypothetical protein